MTSHHGIYRSPKPLSGWIGDVFQRPRPQKCLFRVDAGAVAGLSFGHLSRCLVLAKELFNSYRSDCLFVMKDHQEAVLHAKRFHVSTRTIPISCKDDDEFLLESIDIYRPDWVVIDLPYKDSFAYIDTVRSRRSSVLFLDDWRFRNPGADAYLNSSILSYDHFPNKEKLITHFLGPEYFVFDHSLVDPDISASKDPAEITLSFGGADPTDLTRRAVETLLSQELLGMVFNIVLGPGYKPVRSMQDLVKEQSDTFKIRINPENVIPIFQRSSLVICAGGRTLYELMALGKRSLPIASTEFESETVQRLVELGWLSAGLTSWDPGKFINLLARFLNEG